MSRSPGRSRHGSGAAPVLARSRRKLGTAHAMLAHAKTR
ncbi:hypothetical protein F441_04146 [Phytophthora nicotianae CJ01A1]|uniref:Uncharacterized protein n=6 Tax=Phytophthora nicotianae TaxID=4792 RepID=W2QJP4_PHYN3|nr:hypothetical protein PPTG_22342 [Phytophthora nicotianae INRA-310]ETI52733.1 hypothetical protein F443_04194 [Phytophthora nicotianae P1569]ETK92613.1 hypothetical protein L915_04055 [Phytophthora nicotianae]ETO81411.1 hypothetical protein F444_04246 [Phytophthora nicotianae P1976]ETP22572.1 hypothetical protein F441_04146 [Phytophthora nicotianae CJ01A1]ETP50538.1 hypothetical protein F442_04164 [Phytophthora nicotianae P10297]